jgi:hypothetical protein
VVFLACGLRRVAEEPVGLLDFTDFNGRAAAVGALAEVLAGAFAGAAWGALPFSDRPLSCLSTSAVPPTATSSGHSTSPVTPRAPRVSAAAGVE